MDKGTQKTLIRESPPLSFPIYDKTIQLCYVIPKTWWQAWTRYVGFYSDEAGPDPGDLDNSQLVLSKKNQENLICLRKVAWKRLKGWYNGHPTLKVFIVQGRPKWKMVSLAVVLPSSHKYQVKVSLKISLSQFQEFISKKFNLTGPLEITTYSDTSITKQYSSDYTLSILGFGDVTYVKFSYVSRISSQVVTEFDTLNIDESDDEELQKAIKVSMTETFPHDKSFEMNDLRINDKVREVKKMVESSIVREKTQLKVFSLKRIKMNVEGILRDFK
jgi:hypothetical protein